MFTWLPMLHLPKVPDHFVEMALNATKQKHIVNTNAYMYNTGYQNRQLHKDGKAIPSRVQHGYPMSPEWEQWVRENIVSDFIETSARMSVGDSDTHGIHADNPFKWKFYYMLDRGGDNAETVFYKEKNQPIIRQSTADSITCVNDYSDPNVFEVERVQFPLHTWVLFNATVLHGVEKITGDRKNIAISIVPDSIDFSFIQKNN